MSYYFHYLAHIIPAHLDDLTAHFMLRAQQIHDFQTIFLWCRKYNIHFNLLKCVFFVPVSHLLGFIVSKYGINLGPLKVQDMVELPIRRTMCELQSVQRKEKFIRQFVPDYAPMHMGF